MTVFIVVAIVLLVGAAATFLIRRRSAGGGLDGVHGFRRHMDALSSEARRDVIGRVQMRNGEGDGPHGAPAQSEWSAEPELQMRGIAGQPGVGGRMNAIAPEPHERGADGVVEAESAEPRRDSNGEGTEAAE